DAVTPAVDEAAPVRPSALLRARIAFAVGAIVIVAVARMGVGAEQAKADDAGGHAGRDAPAASRLGRLDRRGGEAGHQRQRHQRVHELLDHGSLPSLTDITPL